MNSLFALTLIISSIASGDSMSVTSKQRYTEAQCKQVVGPQMAGQLARGAAKQGFEIRVTFKCRRAS